MAIHKRLKINIRSLSSTQLLYSTQSGEAELLFWIILSALSHNLFGFFTYMTKKFGLDSLFWFWFFTKFADHFFNHFWATFFCSSNPHPTSSDWFLCTLTHIEQGFLTLGQRGQLWFWVVEGHVLPQSSQVPRSTLSHDTQRKEKKDLTNYMTLCTPTTLTLKCTLTFEITEVTWKAGKGGGCVV